jgi:hypothetical protein
MIHTSLTADEEIRRLKRLGERTHDWCDTNSPPAPPDRAAEWIGQGATAAWGLLTAVARFARRTTQRAGTEKTTLAPKGGAQ